MAAILNLCKRGIMLDSGKITTYGDSEKVVEKYLIIGQVKRGFKKFCQKSTKDFFFTSVSISSPKREPCGEIPLSTGVDIKISYEIKKPIRGMNVAFHLWNLSGTCVLSSTDVDENYLMVGNTRLCGKYNTKCHISSEYLRHGRYTIGLSASIPNYEILDEITSAISFDVIDTGSVESKLGQGRQGIISPLLEWKTQTMKNEQT
jgi:lipopolysaccharide transport system ATP-binding protein